MSMYFDRRNWVDSYIGSLRSLLMHPGSFYAGLPEAHDYVNSLWFLIITVSVPTLVIAAGTLGVSLFLAPMFWLFVVMGTWLWAVYLRWVLRVFAKKEVRTAHAFEICAYANAPLLLAWVPLVNAVVGIWSFVLMWLGLTRNLGLGSGMALAILLVPFLIMTLSGGVLLALLGTYAVQNGMTPPDIL